MTRIALLGISLIAPHITVHVQDQPASGPWPTSNLSTGRGRGPKCPSSSAPEAKPRTCSNPWKRWHPGENRDWPTSSLAWLNHL
ncbi:hypothetical protein BJX62DRAFT_144904 [Aspergillus germanicus]